MIKNDLKKSELLKTLLTPCMLGFCGAFIFFIGKSLLLPDSVSIATVDLTGLIHQYTLKTVQEGSRLSEFKNKMKPWSENLEMVLQSIARKHHVVLLPRQAVITPVKDYTEEAAKLLNQKNRFDLRFDR